MKINFRSSFEKIDDELNKYGYSIWRDADHLKLWREHSGSYVFDRQFQRKAELVRFTRKLIEECVTA